MGFYQISDLERLSGVKAHTIRIWEKRYGIIAPHRTSTNIRFYDDEQLRKLLNVAGLVSSGYKISNVAAMTPEELRITVREVQEEGSPSDSYEIYVNQFVTAMLAFDEIAFNKIFTELRGRFSIEEIVENVFYPFLHKTGLLWSLDDARPVQEHFASSLIRRKLYRLIDELPRATKSKKFLLFLPEGEWHDLPLLFAEYIIRNQGCKTINVSQNVPFSDIVYIVSQVKPDYILSIITSRSDSPEMHQVLKVLQRDFPKVICLLSGSGFSNKGAPEHKNVRSLKSPKDILKFT